MARAATPALAAAVANAGGLGGLGSATLSLAALATEVAAVRAATNGGLNLNFFCHAPPRADAATAAAAAAALAPHHAALGLAPPEAAALPAVPPPFDAARLDWLLAHPPRVASFHFGLPPAAAIARLRAAGVRVLATATTLAEARAVEDAGCDAVIAQGWEAGGHRGAFLPEAADRGVGLFALLPQVVDGVAIPVIAAGGIADGRAIAAALMLGAEGVQIGTGFLLCPEAATSPAARAALAAATDADTHLTAAYSGRPARARATAFGAAFQSAPFADYPLPRAVTGPLLAAAAAAGREDYASFHLQGQAAALARTLPAADLVARLAAEARVALTRS
ncbi:MAG: nitronate monooxygenase [Rhodobacteraceae bacterium]|nr:nitronate monooxygenase [Paracoccaceae bacterium]